MMRLVSRGATLTMDCVHISWRSMVAIICGPTKWRMNSGRDVVSTTPSSPQADEISREASTYWIVALKDGGILVAQKTEQGEKIRLAARVDDMVGASQQLIDIGGIGPGGGVLAQHRQVGGHLAVEQRDFLQFGARELLEAALVGLGQQGGQPVPVRTALLNPVGGECLRHGPEFRSA